MRTHLASSLLRCAGVSVCATLALAALGCGDNLNPAGPPDANPGGSTADAAAPAQDPTAAALYQTPPGTPLAFGVREGNLRNYFHRRGPSAAHLLARSGTEPRLIAAFPTGNQGIGVWFAETETPTELWLGDSADGAVAGGGGVQAIVREESPRAMHGVRATVHSDAESLQIYLSLLANIRTLRDYGYGLCLENAAAFPKLRNETIEYFAEHNVVRIRRPQIGGEYAMELLLKGVDGTELSVAEVEVPPRPSCVDSAGDAREQVVEIKGAGGVSFEIYTLMNDEPLTPIEKEALLSDTPADSFELNALAFLSYAEKLQAGSWRFLTYFGRDTLLSVRMLLPGLNQSVIDAALTSVLERINLTAEVPDPYFDYTIEVGDVAHEEELSDYAAWKNDMETSGPTDVRQPRYDYKMVDDDFLLAPVLVEYFEKIEAEAASPDDASAQIAAFLDRKRSDGTSFREAIEANLALVLERARPFAEAADPDAANLVALKNTVPVGQWRDSNEGIAFGRYAFDVNVALVPAALAAASDLYTRLDKAAEAAEADTFATKWTDIDELFLIEAPVDDVRSNVSAYATKVGVTDTSDQIEAEQGNTYGYYAIALDGQGAKLPVMHTDHSFVLEFTNPSAAYLQRIAATITNDFPAGLMSEVGVMVANPGLAAANFTVVNPRDLKLDDDDEVVNLQDTFTNSHYHGAVVWSWQQALLASGMRRQLERDDLDATTRDALQSAECKLWATIDAAEEVRAGELWSWEANGDGALEYRAFGYNLADVDESNAAQLWSTVYLVVKKPTVCAAAAR